MIFCTARRFKGPAAGHALTDASNGRDIDSGTTLNQPFHADNRLCCKAKAKAKAKAICDCDSSHGIKTVVDERQADASTQYIIRSKQQLPRRCNSYVSIIASRELHVSGLFLMAPAIGLPGYNEPLRTTATRPICIVHGWNDDVVPVQKVFDFAAQHKADLHILDADHALHGSLDRLEDLCIAFLDAQLKDYSLRAADTRRASGGG